MRIASESKKRPNRATVMPQTSLDYKYLHHPRTMYTGYQRAFDISGFGRARDDRNVRHARGGGDFFEQINQIRHDVSRLDDRDMDRRHQRKRPALAGRGANDQRAGFS